MSRVVRIFTIIFSVILVFIISCKLGPPVERDIYEGENPFAWIDGSDPSLPVWSSAANGWVPHPEDTRDEIIIDQSFQVAPQTIEFPDNKCVFISQI